MTYSICLIPIIIKNFAKIIYKNYSKNVLDNIIYLSYWDIFPNNIFIKYLLYLKQFYKLIKKNIYIDI